MTLHLPSHVTPAIASPEGYSNNGQLPNSAALRRIAAGLNHLACYQKKAVFSRCQDISGLTAGAGGSAASWVFYFRTSEATSALRVYCGLVNTAFAATDPYVTVTLYTTAGATASTKDIHHNGRNGPSSGATVLNMMGHYHTDLTGLSADTEYYGTVTISDGARLLYLFAHEAQATHANDATTGITNPGDHLSGKPIYDAHIQDLMDSAKALWRHSAAHLVSFSGDYLQSGNPTTSLTTYTNLLDGSSTTVSSATPGYVLPLGNRTTTSRTTVPLKMAVCATRTAGTGSLDVRFYDGTNSLALTGITTGGTGNWYTTTGTLPASDVKFDIQARVSVGTTTFRIDGVSLFQWES